jgi:hypothetical protein
VTPETWSKIEGTVAPPLRIAVAARGLAGAAAGTATATLEPNLLLRTTHRLVAGQQLYQDIVFFTGPFPFELLAFPFRMFGEKIPVVRAAVVVLGGPALATTYGLTGRVGVRAPARLTAAIVVSPVLLFPLYSIHFHTKLSFTVLAVYAAVRASESATIRFVVYALRGQRDQVLQSVELPADPHGDCGWQPIEAHLSAYSGQRITLRLETVPAPRRSRALNLGGGSPRVAVPAAMDGEQ